MSYLKPNNSEEQYNVALNPTITQNGYKAIRFIGDDIPDDITDGFKYYGDDNKIISDLSDYKFFYAHNTYAIAEDIIINPLPNNTAPSTAYIPTDPTMYLISQLDNRVDALEPYTESKIVYIDDTECTFDIAKQGIISVSLIVDDIQIPCEYEVVNDKIKVSFEPLEAVGMVTLIIQ